MQSCKQLMVAVFLLELTDRRRCDARRGGRSGKPPRRIRLPGAPWSRAKPGGGTGGLIVCRVGWWSRGGSNPSADETACNVMHPRRLSKPTFGFIFLDDLALRCCPSGFILFPEYGTYLEPKINGKRASKSTYPVYRSDAEG